MTDMQYSRNLGTGNGIELLKLPQVVNSVAEPVAGPVIYRLYPNYPNPFNPSTTIGFELRSAGRVTLKLYDAEGRLAATLAEGTMAAGVHTLRFDGSSLASGMYFYRLTAGNFSEVRKMLLLR